MDNALWSEKWSRHLEIRDPVHGTIDFNPKEVAVLDSAVFQRLRSIKQLGFGEFSFPGGVHNRYIHSIGATHLVGRAFDTIFHGYPFKNMNDKARLWQTVRLACMLHDCGHGPLSHSTEEVMPKLKDLHVPLYEQQGFNIERQANHEDYTIKFITDSPLAKIISEQFQDITPFHVACLIDPTIKCPDDFFIVDGVNFRTILSQLVSSELDCDRMDYLIRDSYFCGTDYGKIELSWLLQNLTFYRVEDRLHLAINRRALYTFDDFLISRHHMYLMVYFHHKAIIYDEMLMKYLRSKDCTYRIPADINAYLEFTDYHLHQHLRSAKNQWAQRITERKPYRVIFEIHETKENPRVQKIKEALESEGIDSILTSSVARLSKYHSSFHTDPSRRIYVVDQYDRKSTPYAIEETTQIFKKYEENRRIERLYVAPEKYTSAEVVLTSRNI